jgi:hypothetical protein
LFKSGRNGIFMDSPKRKSSLSELERPYTSLSNKKEPKPLQKCKIKKMNKSNNSAFLGSKKRIEAGSSSRVLKEWKKHEILKKKPVTGCNA